MLAFYVSQHVCSVVYITYEWKNEEMGNKNHGLFKTSHHHLPTSTDENHKQPLSHMCPILDGYGVMTVWKFRIEGNDYWQ